MINRFRALNPLNILWLGVLLILLRIGLIIKPPQNIDIALFEPFTRLLIPFNLESFFTPVNNITAAAIFTFAQALWLNQIVNHYNLIGKPTFLPALMYITVSALFPPFLLLSPPIICNFLVLWMIDKVLSIYKNESPISTAFDLGMIVGLGSLVYFPFIYMFLAIWIAFIIFRPFNWREWIVVPVGFATIFFFIGVYYYWNDKMPLFNEIWLPLTNTFPSQIEIHYINYLVLIPVIVILVLAFFVLQKNFFKSYVQVRKSFQMLAVIFIVGLLSFYVKTNFRISHFMLCAAPAAIIFAYYFLYSRVRWFYETLYLLLVISIIYFQFNTF